MGEKTEIWIDSDGNVRVRIGNNVHWRIAVLKPIIFKEVFQIEKGCQL